MEQKWKSSVPPLVMELGQHYLLRRRKREERSWWKTAPCVLLSKSSSSSSSCVRDRLDPKENRQKINKSVEENANRCTMQNADPRKNLVKEPHTGGAAAEGARVVMIMCFPPFMWRNPTKKPNANQSGGVALLLLSSGSRCNQTNGGRATRTRSNKPRFALHRSATAPPAGRLEMDNVPSNGDSIEIVGGSHRGGFSFPFSFSFVFLILVQMICPTLCRARPCQRVAVFSKATAWVAFCLRVLPKGCLPSTSRFQKDAKTSNIYI